MWIEYMRNGSRARQYKVAVYMHGLWARNSRNSASLLLNSTEDCHDKLSDHERELVQYWHALADAELEIAEYHDRLREKYAYASRFPWLRLEPDPLEPVRPPEPGFVREWRRSQER